MDTKNGPQPPIGRRIRALFALRGVTSEEVAALSEVLKEDRLNNLTSKSKSLSPKPEELREIARILGANLRFLESGQGPPLVGSVDPVQLAGASGDLPMYVREMVNIPPRYWEELSEKRLELLVESLRLTTGRGSPIGEPAGTGGGNAAGVTVKSESEG